MEAFQWPIIPELFFGAGIAIIPTKLWNKSSPGEVKEYVNTFKDSTCRKAIISWYRANKKLPIHFGNVSIPTILIWGNKDIAIARAGISMTRDHMQGEYQMIELDAGHTLVQEEFKKVSEEILSHIQHHPISLNPHSNS